MRYVHNQYINYITRISHDMKNLVRSVKVSIVTVVFNAVDLILPTVLSVINQEYDNFEYIVVDGGSSDGTVELLGAYDDKISTVISEKDDGIYHAMNKGIDLATGEWVIFMNAGDMFYNSKVLADIFNKPVREDFIYGDYIWINVEDGCGRYVKSRPLDLMWQRISFSHQSLFSRLSLLKETKFNLKYTVVSDYESYFSHYIKGYRFLYVPFAISKVISGGMSDKLIIKRTFERWQVVRKYDRGIEKDIWYILFLVREILPAVLIRKYLSIRN